MAPPGMPAPLVRRIHAAAVEALRHPEGRQRLEQIGFTVVASSPEEYAAFQREEVERWRGVVRTAGIKPE
jgi:tripartite-type tricarboxylate transporter receptor subunit TctC